MKITIVYHVYKNTINLEESISALVKQNDKNFELIIVDDCSSKKVKDILNRIDFSFLPNIKYLSFNENLGHSFSFNKGLEISSGDYIYYTGSNVVLSEIFVEKINEVIAKNSNAEIISFTNTKSEQPIRVLSNPDEVLRDHFRMHLKNKIFSVKFLTENKIALTIYKYYPLLFLMDILYKFNVWVVIHEELAKFYTNNKASYNLYNILEQGEIIINKYKNTKIWKANEEQIEYFLIYSILATFLLRMFRTYESTKINQLALDVAEKWLRVNVNNWQQNKFIAQISPEETDKIKSYLRDFRFATRYVRKYLRK